MSACVQVICVSVKCPVHSFPKLQTSVSVAVVWLGVPMLIGAAANRRSQSAPPLTIGLLPVGLVYHRLLASLPMVLARLVSEHLMSPSGLVDSPRDQPIRSRAAPVKHLQIIESSEL